MWEDLPVPDRPTRPPLPEVFPPKDVILKLAVEHGYVRDENGFLERTRNPRQPFGEVDVGLLISPAHPIEFWLGTIGWYGPGWVGMDKVNAIRSGEYPKLRDIWRDYRA